MKEKEVKTKEKSLKQTYREAWMAFIAYRSKKRKRRDQVEKGTKKLSKFFGE